MFPEHRELITQLKNENPHFLSLYDKHERLDDEIARREGPNGNGYSDEVVLLKKEKLRLKDKLYQMVIAANHG